MSIGLRVSEIRNDAKLNQKAFADILRTSQSHISGIEKDRKPLTEKMKRLICIEFNVNEDWLSTGEGSKYNTAAVDVLELDDLARGEKPIDPKGHLKAEAIMLAARLNEIYPNVCTSCESIDWFIKLFMIPEIADMFNTIAFAFMQSKDDKGTSFRLLAKMLSNMVTDEALGQDLGKLREERINKQRKEPLPNYLHALYTDYKKDGIF